MLSVGDVVFEKRYLHYFLIGVASCTNIILSNLVPSNKYL